jgi:hypothetical protein
VVTAVFGLLNQLTGQTDIRNHLCVLPFGPAPSGRETPWTAEELMPILHHLHEGKPNGPMFGGLVLDCDSVHPGTYLNPAFAGFGKLPNQTDWLLWLDALFLACDRLDEICVAPAVPLDVWISVPYPHPTQAEFGVVGSKSLDFRNETNRMAAIEWWIDRFAERLDRVGRLASCFKVRGFYWTKKSIDVSDEPLVRRFTKHASTRGYCTMWLPYYGSFGMLKAESLGFDAVAVHPNYYGNAGYGKEWLSRTARFARNCNFGIQIDCGQGRTYSGTQMLDYLNEGAADREVYMKDTFLVYTFKAYSPREILEKREDHYSLLHAFINGTFTRTHDFNS